MKRATQQSDKSAHKKTVTINLCPFYIPKINGLFIILLSLINEKSKSIAKYKKALIPRTVKKGFRQRKH